MPKTVTPEYVIVVEESVPANSRKREITASVVAGVVTVSLGLAASGLIEKIATRVKHSIAPPPEKPEDE